MAFEKYLVALITIGIVDAISYMLVTPSLAFYVLQNGGSMKQYGLIMSAFSFSSFCTKPFIGWWSDKRGFRVPYFVSITVALMGGVVYVLASAMPKGNPAVYAVLLARLLGGCGAANSALGFAYIARSVPPSKQTYTSSQLSLCRILGMVVGPGMNVLVANVDIPITHDWKFDSLNSVGVVLIIANFLSLMAVLYLLEEPKEEDHNASDKTNKAESGDAVADTSYSTGDAFRSFFSIDILVPMLSIYTFNANFQLIETGFAPAANDALGWGPVQTSIALGSVSFLIAFHMFNVMQLSRKGVADSNLLMGGLINSIIAYLAIYHFWIKDSTTWNFYLPIALGVSSFPYMAATTRSIFTAVTNAKPELSDYHGFMQAVLSMAASVAGFTTPGIVAAYMLRSPEEVLASDDKRELTPYTLLAPALSGVVLLGTLYLRATGKMPDSKKEPSTESEKSEALAANEATPDQESPTESSTLLRRTSFTSSRRSRATRRSSNLEIMLEGNFEGLLDESMRSATEL